MFPTTKTTVMDPRYLDHNAFYPKPPSFFRQFKVYNGTFSGDSLWKIFLRPYQFILSPVVRLLPVEFCRRTRSFAYTIFQTWLVFLTASLSTVWLSTFGHL